MSKKKANPKPKKGKTNSNRNLLIIGAIVVAILLIFVVYYYVTTNQSPTPIVADNGQLSLDSSNHFIIPASRGPVEATVIPTNISSDNYTVETIDYKSLGDDVYASLCIPKNVTKPPVVVVLPAATITKELDFPMAQYLSSMGYASITLDERGNQGQTGGDFAGNWQSGFNDFLNGSYTIQYKQVYDAVRALDYVQTRNDLEGNNTAILGESIGGMWSIIAAGVDPRFKGVVCVSSSDFPLANYDNTSAGNITANQFISSVQPSNYLSLLPPRKLVMIQFTDDPTIHVQDAKALFDKASEPKAWYQYEGDIHGLPNATYMPDLQRELQGMLGK